LLAFDEMYAALNELKTGRHCRKDLFADESNSFGIGFDGLAEALQPLGRVNRVADDRVVDPVRRADIADNDWPQMDAHADANRLESFGNAAFVVSRERTLYGDSRSAS